MSRSVVVAIGMPVFNGERHLSRALDSLLAQSHTSIEIHVSDNASTDGTRGICQDYLASDPRIRYSRNTRNEGAIANFRKVLKSASAPYFMWASHDDWWEPDFVEHLLGLHQSAPGLCLVACEAQYALNDGTPLPFFPEGDYWRLNRHSQDNAFGRLRAVLAHAYGNLIYGLFDHDALCYDDDATSLDPYVGSPIFNEIPLLLQVACRGKILVSDRVLFHKRTNLATYFQAAAEYGALAQVAPRDAPIGTFPSFATLDAFVEARRPPRHRAPKPRRMLGGLARDVVYHWETYWDVLRALPLLNLPTPDRIAVGALATYRLLAHLVRLQFLKAGLLQRGSRGFLSQSRLH